MRLALDMVALGILLLFLFNEMIGRGIAGFFVGAAVYYATERIKRRTDAKAIARWAAALALLAWSAVVVDIYTGVIETALQPLANLLPAKFVPLYMAERPNILLVPFILVVSPLTLAALALHEQVLAGRYARVAFLGDISYSTYLLHFPMQIGAGAARAAFRLDAADLPDRLGAARVLRRTVRARLGELPLLRAAAAKRHPRSEISGSVSRQIAARRVIFPQAVRPAWCRAPPDWVKPGCPRSASLPSWIPRRLCRRR